MSEGILTGYITIRAARERLHDAFWPDAVYSLGTVDTETATDPENPHLRGRLKGYTLDLKDERMAHADARLIASLRDGALVGWYEFQGELRYLEPNHWRDETAEKLLYHGRGYIGAQPVSYLLKQPEFDAWLAKQPHATANETQHRATIKTKTGPKTPYDAPLKALLGQLKQQRGDIYFSSPDAIMKEVDRVWARQGRGAKLPSSRSARNAAINRIRDEIDSDA